MTERRPRAPRPPERSITVFVLRRAAMEISLMLRVEAGYRARPGWRARRACAGHGDRVQWWYNNCDKGQAICRSCPVRMDCLAATCEAENELPLFEILGYAGVRSQLRVEWQERRRAAPAS